MAEPLITGHGTFLTPITLALLAEWEKQRKIRHDDHNLRKWLEKSSLFQKKEKCFNKNKGFFRTSEDSQLPSPQSKCRISESSEVGELFEWYSVPQPVKSLQHGGADAYFIRCSGNPLARMKVTFRRLLRLPFPRNISPDDIEFVESIEVRPRVDSDQRCYCPSDWDAFIALPAANSVDHAETGYCREYAAGFTCEKLLAQIVAAMNNELECCVQLSPPAEVVTQELFWKSLNSAEIEHSPQPQIYAAPAAFLDESSWESDWNSAAIWDLSEKQSDPSSPGPRSSTEPDHPVSKVIFTRSVPQIGTIIGPPMGGEFWADPLAVEQLSQNSVISTLDSMDYASNNTTSAVFPGSLPAPQPLCVLPRVVTTGTGCLPPGETGLLAVDDVLKGPAFDSVIDASRGSKSVMPPGCLDSYTVGNVLSRCRNGSINPNCIALTVLINGIPYVFVVTIRPIEAYEECLIMRDAAPLANLHTWLIPALSCSSTSHEDIPCTALCRNVDKLQQNDYATLAIPFRYRLAVLNDELRSSTGLRLFERRATPQKSMHVFPENNNYFPQRGLPVGELNTVFADISWLPQVSSTFCSKLNSLLNKLTQSNSSFAQPALRLYQRATAGTLEFLEEVMREKTRSFKWKDVLKYPQLTVVEDKCLTATHELIRMYERMLAPLQFYFDLHRLVECTFGKKKVCEEDAHSRHPLLEQILIGLLTEKVTSLETFSARTEICAEALLSCESLDECSHPLPFAVDKAPLEELATSILNSYHSKLEVKATCSSRRTGPDACNESLQRATNFPREGTLTTSFLPYIPCFQDPFRNEIKEVGVPAKFAATSTGSHSVSTRQHIGKRNDPNESLFYSNHCRRNGMPSKQRSHFPDPDSDSDDGSYFTRNQRSLQETAPDGLRQTRKTEANSKQVYEHLMAMPFSRKSVKRSRVSSPAEYPRTAVRSLSCADLAQGWVFSRKKLSAQVDWGSTKIDRRPTLTTSNRPGSSSASEPVYRLHVKHEYVVGGYESANNCSGYCRSTLRMKPLNNI